MHKLLACAVLASLTGCLDDQELGVDEESIAVIDPGDSGGDTGGGTLPLGAPTSLVARGTTGFATALSWIDQSSAEVAFAIECTTYPNALFPWIEIARTSANATSYTDPNVCGNGSIINTIGLNVEYRVRAIGGQNNTAGAYSNVAIAIPAPATQPSAVAIAWNRIDVHWTDASWNETAFVVERALAAAGPYATVGTAAAKATSYSDTSVTGSTLYYYRVRARSAGGSSAATPVVGAMTPISPPAAPANLAVTQVQGGVVSATWTDNSDSEVSFELQCTLFDTALNFPYQTIATTGANTTSVTASCPTLILPANYKFRVSATNASGSTCSTEVVVGLH